MCFQKPGSPDLEEIRGVASAINGLELTYAKCEEERAAVIEELEKVDGVWESEGIIPFAKSGKIAAAKETYAECLTITSSNPLPQMEEESCALMQQTQNVLMSAEECRGKHIAKKKDAEEQFPHNFLAVSDSATKNANINKNGDIIERLQQIQAAYDAFPTAQHDARIREILAEKKDAWREHEDAFLQGDQVVKNFLSKLDSINDEARKQFAFLNCKKGMAEKEHADAHEEEVRTRITLEEVAQEFVKALQYHQQAKRNKSQQHIHCKVLEHFVDKMSTHFQMVESETREHKERLANRRSIMDDEHQASQKYCADSQEAVKAMIVQTTTVAYGNTVKTKQLADATRKVINNNVRKLEQKIKTLKEELKRARNDFDEDGDNDDERIQEIREAEKTCAAQHKQLEAQLEDWEERGFASNKRRKAFVASDTMINFQPVDSHAKEWVANVMPPEEMENSTDLMVLPEEDEVPREPTDGIAHVDVRALLARIAALEETQRKKASGLDNDTKEGQPSKAIGQINYTQQEQSSKVSEQNGNTQQERPSKVGGQENVAEQGQPSEFSEKDKDTHEEQPSKASGEDKDTKEGQLSESSWQDKDTHEEQHSKTSGQNGNTQQEQPSKVGGQENVAEQGQPSEFSGKDKDTHEEQPSKASGQDKDTKEGQLYESSWQDKDTHEEQPSKTSGQENVAEQGQPSKVGGQENGTERGQPSKASGQDKDTHQKQSSKVGGQENGTEQGQPSKASGENNTQQEQPSKVGGQENVAEQGQPPKASGQDKDTHQKQPSKGSGPVVGQSKKKKGKRS